MITEQFVRSGWAGKSGMSLGIAIKGSEGVVLAADSRVTLFNPIQNQATPNQVLLLPATFDNATKVLRVAGQDRVGAVTYGLGAFITAQGPRTMHSYIPEFEEKLKADKVGPNISTKEFAKRLSDFFKTLWDTVIKRPPNAGEEINFLVGGFDERDAYGKVYLFVIPTKPAPQEQNQGDGQFGISWGGQMDLVYKLLFGFDPELPAYVESELKLPAGVMAPLRQKMEQRFAAGIPYQFLPLQDCINLAIFLIQSTINFQRFRTTTVRGVGGHVDVATITKSEGFLFRAQRQITADIG
jgi:hypothetical protein